MIKPYVLEKINIDDGTTVVIGRYRSFCSALKRYNLLNCIKYSMGLRDSISYKITTLPILFTIYRRDISNFYHIKVNCYDDYNNAICRCNGLNKNSDGSCIYHIECTIKEEV